MRDEYGHTLRKAHDFLKASQILKNPSGDFTAMYRHICKGAWSFSMHDQGLQVSDCTAEGLKVLSPIQHHFISIKSLLFIRLYKYIHQCVWRKVFFNYVTYSNVKVIRNKSYYLSDVISL